MPMIVRLDGGLAILSNFGRLMDDPRYVDAGRDVRALLDEGWRRFVIDLDSLRGLGETSLALLTTVTRLIRQNDAEVVMIRVHRDALRDLDAMRMDDYWEILDTLDEARAYFDDLDDEPSAEDP